MESIKQVYPVILCAKNYKKRPHFSFVVKVRPLLQDFR
ncbi:hypothetical protein PMCN06_1271 [Pasteurella multocida subsp. multocida str. HN06]|nr:hypothetical protein PMCN06_1271 [Pasteurella multocida subsp. multocida str. HN06]